MARAYRLVARPTEVDHGHPFVVSDCQQQLHYHLTRFSKFAIKSRTFATVRGYLYALLPYFTWLDTDSRQVQAQRHWQEPPEQVRFAVDDYLTQHMRCQIGEHPLGFQMVYRTGKTPAEVRTFLTALKCFYKLMKLNGYYSHPNPLIDSSAKIFTALEAETDDANQIPRMPDISGVEKPSPRKRLTDSYFKLESEEWVPQVIDNPDFYRLILEAGRQLPNWGLREGCVTRLLFESGGRISEVVGVTLEDWMKLGLKQEISTFSKRSRGRRVKVLRFSNDTAKLLRRYFNTERIKFSPDRYTLSDYQEKARLKQVDLSEVPLFLTMQRTPFSPQNYRDNYWKPACDIAGIEADLHQARHWYVTSAIRQIYAIAGANHGEVERLKRTLQQYMAWRSDDTIKAYDHFFDSIAHAKIQDAVHQQMDWDLNQRLDSAKTEPPPAFEVHTQVSVPGSLNLPEDEDFDYLRRIGG
ncbi:site-specific integrase [Trichocoleus desertorum AS-A10]|uniref:tyrosine-type recombinase/integrase n=1 Tax=Trichocoleus desertorum TaxID=1481672 RepID=UPI00329809E9